MNPGYTPQAGRFNAYAVKNVFLYGSRLYREEKRGRAAVLTHAAAAPCAPSEPPQAKQIRKLQRALLQHGNAKIPEALMAATTPDMTTRERKMITRDKVLFAAALFAGVFPELQACNGLKFVPLGKVGLRKLIDQTDMPADTTTKLWDAISLWKSRDTRRKSPRRRGFQTLLAKCCGLSVSTVNRSLAASGLRLAEPYKNAVERVVEAVRRERMGSSADDPT
jgi:hypothetical protein